MTKQIWFSVVFIVVLIMGLVLPFVWGGSFVTMLPGYGSAVNAVYGLFGQELHCSDLHGGNRCALRETPKTRNRRETAEQLKFQSFLGCSDDQDCYVTEDGQCVTGRSAAGDLGALPQNARPGSEDCVCKKGPVEYGCVPRDIE